MTDHFRAALKSSWARNASYAQRLVSGLAPADFVAQPVTGRIINHPAWILCHLNLYAALVLALLRAEVVEDVLGKPYARGSSVSLNSADYPDPKSILSEFTRLHDQTAAALDSAPDAVFNRPTPLERIRPMAPTVGELLVMLMIKHESFHLGQLSAWRRAMGLAPVEM